MNTFAHFADAESDVKLNKIFKTNDEKEDQTEFAQSASSEYSIGLASFTANELVKIDDISADHFIREGCTSNPKIIKCPKLSVLALGAMIRDWSGIPRGQVIMEAKIRLEYSEVYDIVKYYYDYYLANGGQAAFDIDLFLREFWPKYIVEKTVIYTQAAISSTVERKQRVRIVNTSAMKRPYLEFRIWSQVIIQEIIHLEMRYPSFIHHRGEAFNFQKQYQNFSQNTSYLLNFTYVSGKEDKAVTEFMRPGTQLWRTWNETEEAYKAKTERHLATQCRKRALFTEEECAKIDKIVKEMWSKNAKQIKRKWENEGEVIIPTYKKAKFNGPEAKPDNEDNDEIIVSSGDETDDFHM